MIPELRTTTRFAISLAVGAVLAIAVAVLGAGKLEDGLGSSGGATVLLTLWCLIGCGAAIAGIVDAYVRPEGERLELITTIAATVFGLLTLLVLTGIVVGATGAVA